MRVYYANQPAAIIIGLLSLAVVVSLAIVFLPIFLVLLGLFLAAVALFWGWSWLKVKLGLASPEPYADWREVMRKAESQARHQYGAGRTTSESVYVEADVTVESEPQAKRSVGSTMRRKWKMTDVEDAETR